jgi:hypothetical protein
MLENSSPVLESRRAAPFCLLRGTFRVPRLHQPPARLQRRPTPQRSLDDPGSYAWFSDTTPEREGATPLSKRGGAGALEVTGDPSGATLAATGAQIKAKMIQEVKVP